MITFFTSPKPFVGHIKTIQENAIHSWKLLVPDCEVILLGNENGVGEAAANFRCRNLVDVQCNAYGTPLISDMFLVAQKNATHNVMCYVNCDIIFTKSIVNAVKAVNNRKRYLLVGQRYDVAISEPLLFDDSRWDDRVVEYTNKNGTLHSYYGIDYFIFPKWEFKFIPQFTVGRGGWDNWMIYNARRKHIPVIDCTADLIAIHQNHDYSHCSGAQSFAYTDGPEAKMNLDIIGNLNNQMSIGDALWALENGRVRFKIECLGEHIDRLPRLYPCLAIPAKYLRKILGGLKLGVRLSNIINRMRRG